VTVDDPRTYTRPWTGAGTIRWVPDDTDPLEYVCDEFNVGPLVRQVATGLTEEES